MVADYAVSSDVWRQSLVQFLSPWQASSHAYKEVPNPCSLAAVSEH